MCKISQWCKNGEESGCRTWGKVNGKAKPMKSCYSCSWQVSRFFTAHQHILGRLAVGNQSCFCIWQLNQAGHLAAVRVWLPNNVNDTTRGNSDFTFLNRLGTLGPKWPSVEWYSTYGTIIITVWKCQSLFSEQLQKIAYSPARYDLCVWWDVKT